VFNNITIALKSSVFLPSKSIYKVRWQGAKVSIDYIRRLISKPLPSCKISSFLLKVVPLGHGPRSGPCRTSLPSPESHDRPLGPDTMRLSLKLRPYALRPFRGLYKCYVVVSGVKWV
jgi:hypothetical protein